MARTLRLANAIINVAINQAALNAGMNHLRHQIGGIRSYAVREAGMINSAFTRAFLISGIGVGQGGILGGALEISGWFEQTGKTIRAMVGDADKANTMFEEIQDTARKTSMSIREVTASAQYMLAQGANPDEVMPRLKVIVDAVSALGGGQEKLQRVVLAINQIASSSSLKTQDLNQLAQANIKAFHYLAEAAGFGTGPEGIGKIRDALKRGQIDANEGLKAIISGLQRDFEGAAEARANTFLGRWERFTEELTFLFKEIGDILKPIADMMLKIMIPAVMKLTETMKDWDQVVQYAMLNFGNGIEYAMTHITELTARMENFLKNLEKRPGEVMENFGRNVAETFQWLGEVIVTFFMDAFNNMIAFAKAIPTALQNMASDLTQGKVPRRDFGDEFKGTKSKYPAFPEWGTGTGAGEEDDIIKNHFDWVRERMKKGMDANFEAWQREQEEAGFGADIDLHALALGGGKGKDGKGGKKKGAEFLDIKQLWRRSQEAVFEDPQMMELKQLNKNGQDQVAALNKIDTKMQELLDNGGMGTAIVA